MTKYQPSMPTCLTSSSDGTVAFSPVLVTWGSGVSVAPDPAGHQAEDEEPGRDHAGVESAGTSPLRVRAGGPSVALPVSVGVLIRGSRDRAGA